MKKRILSIILAAIMVVSLFPVTAFAEGSQMETDNSVASVTCSGVTTYYETMAAAFSAANGSASDCEITILKSCSHEGPLTLNNSSHVITLNTGDAGTVFTITATAGSQNLIHVKSHVKFTGNGGMITANCNNQSDVRAINVDGSSAQIDTYDGFVLNLINGGSSFRGLVTINGAKGYLHDGKILCPKAGTSGANKHLSTIVAWTSSSIDIYGGEYHWDVDGFYEGSYWAGVLDFATDQTFKIYGGYFDGPLWWDSSVGAVKYTFYGGKFTTNLLKNSDDTKEGTQAWVGQGYNYLGDDKHSKEITETYNGTTYHYEVYDEKVKVMNVDTHETYNSISAGVDAVAEGQTLKMLQDISENVEVASGKKFTLDLSGYVLSNVTDVNSSVITVNTGGGLTVIDSVPTASHAGYVDADGLWHLGDTVLENSTEKSITGGVITGGVAENGGGVYVSGGAFTMTGGTISGNMVSQYGGGVYVSGGAFTMTGGTISGNTVSQYGGGVYLNDGSFTLGGTVQIIGNTAGSETKTANNLYLPDGKTIELGTGVAAPTTGMLVGVTMQTPGKFTTSGKKAQEIFFASDVSPYVVKINNNNTTDNYSDDYLELTTSTTYTVSFDTQGHGTQIDSISNVTYGSTISKPDDPTDYSYTFCGWYVDTAFTQMWNFENDRVRANMTLYAKWVDISTTSTVIGILKDDADSPSVVSGATVKLMKGDVQWGSGQTDSDGKFNFNGVPAGTYQIVATKGDVSTTALVVIDNNGPVKINGRESTEENPAILTICNSGNKTASSNVEVMEDTPDIIVGGLEEIAKTAKNDASSGDNIKIKLQVESKPVDISDVAQNSIRNMSEADGKEIEFIDMSLLKQVNGGLPTDIGGSNTKLLTIVIPFDFSKVKAESVMLLRKHGNDNAEKMTKITVAPTEGSSEGYLVDESSGTITVYAKKFSTYAIAYDTHTHDGITFKAWMKTDSLPSEADLTEGVGSYYLTGDVTLEGTWNVPAGTSDAVKTTNLCLNGHLIKFAESKTGSAIKVPQYAMLNLYDCGTIEHNGYVDTNGLWHLGTPTNGETVKNITGGIITGGTGTTDSSEFLGGGIYVNDGTLTMNGGTIAGCSATKGGGVFTWGNMTMNGGSAIIGCTATIDGGGVCACNCNFSMTGNSVVSDCVAKNGGGGVYTWAGNGQKASFTMSDASTIKNCIAKHTYNTKLRSGGGLCVENSTFKMLGGTITGNKSAADGGGVSFISGNVILGGTAQITGNTLSDGSTKNNLYLEKTTISFATGDNIPKEGMKVGVTTDTKPTVGNPVTFTTNGAVASDAAFFFSDNDQYYVKHDETNNVLQLFVPAKTLYNNAPQSSESTNHGYIEIVGYAFTGDTVTLTTHAIANYRLSSLTLSKHGDSYITYAAVAGTNNTYTFTMPDNEVDISAVFETIPIPPAPVYYEDPVYTVPVTGDKSSVQVRATISGSNATVKNITSEEIETVGTGSNVIVDLTGVPKSVTAVTIPKTTFDNVAASEADGLEIQFPNGNVTVFDKTVLAAILDQAEGNNIKLVVDRDSKAERSMTSAQKETFKELNNPVALDAYFISGGRRISDFKGGEAELTAVYPTDNPVRVWYIKSDGTKELIPCSYDGENAVFVVTHFSHYVIEQLDAGPYAECPQDETCVYAHFTDADPKAWYHDGVHFCVEKKYMVGVEDHKFDPTGTLSRGMIVTMLWRMEGSPVVDYDMSFSDVKTYRYYYDAIRWAQSTGVVEGYNEESFGPNDNVTREQLAAILMRYAMYKDIDVSARSDLAGFTDVNKIGGWALENVKWANAVGIIEGRTTTTIVPKGDTTRAEAACMVQRFCENILKK